MAPIPLIRGTKRMAGKAHHCSHGDISHALSDRCLRQGHQDYCETCNHVFDTWAGCINHKYERAYNEASFHKGKDGHDTEDFDRRFGVSAEDRAAANARNAAVELAKLTVTEAPINDSNQQVDKIDGDVPRAAAARERGKEKAKQAKNKKALAKFAKQAGALRQKQKTVRKAQARKPFKPAAKAARTQAYFQNVTALHSGAEEE